MNIDTVFDMDDEGGVLDSGGDIGGVDRDSLEMFSQRYVPFVMRDYLVEAGTKDDESFSTRCVASRSEIFNSTEYHDVVGAVILALLNPNGNWIENLLDVAAKYGRSRNSFMKSIGEIDGRELYAGIDEILMAGGSEWNFATLVYCCIPTPTVLDQGSYEPFEKYVLDVVAGIVDVKDLRKRMKCRNAFEAIYMAMFKSLVYDRERPYNTEFSTSDILGVYYTSAPTIYESCRVIEKFIDEVYTVVSRNKNSSIALTFEEWRNEMHIDINAFATSSGISNNDFVDAEMNVLKVKEVAMFLIDKFTTETGVLPHPSSIEVLSDIYGTEFFGFKDAIRHSKIVSDYIVHVGDGNEPPSLSNTGRKIMESLEALDLGVRSELHAFEELVSSIFSPHAVDGKSTLVELLGRIKDVRGIERSKRVSRILFEFLNALTRARLMFRSQGMKNKILEYIRPGYEKGSSGRSIVSCVSMYFPNEMNAEARKSEFKNDKVVAFGAYVGAMYKRALSVLKKEYDVNDVFRSDSDIDADNIKSLVSIRRSMKGSVDGTDLELSANLERIVNSVE